MDHNDTKRSNRRKRGLREAHDEDQTMPPATANQAPDMAPTLGEKKRRVDHEQSTTPHPPSPEFNPQIPLSCTTSGSFLEDNSQIYISSPTPRPNTTSPPINNLDIEDLLGSTDADTAGPADQDQSMDDFAALHDRLLAAKEWESQPNDSFAKTKDPMEKYTKQPEKKIHVHYSHPTAAFDNIDIQQVYSWASRPGGKLLAHPFGEDVKIPEFQLDIKKKIFAAVVEITQSSDVGFYAPKPGSSPRDMPRVYLIYNLTNAQRRTLLERDVWSSRAITFRVTTMDPIRPNYLFGISGLITKNVTEVRDVVQQTWEEQKAEARLSPVLQSLPEHLTTKVEAIIDEVTKSMTVEMLNTKEPGDKSAPTFNVYIEASIIPDDGLWRRLRNHYASLKYALPFQEPGTANANLFLCTICYSIDHPRGMCRFPTTEGWNGPAWRIPGPKRDNYDKPRNRLNNPGRLIWSDTFAD